MTYDVIYHVICKKVECQFSSLLHFIVSHGSYTAEQLVTW